MDLMNAKENLLTMQLLQVCIFQSKAINIEIARVEIDVTIDSLGTASNN